MKEKSMPVSKIMNYQENIYELTNAVIKRSHQVTKTNNEYLALYRNKPVSLAMDEILDRKVCFRKE